MVEWFVGGKVEQFQHLLFVHRTLITQTFVWLDSGGICQGHNFVAVRHFTSEIHLSLITLWSSNKAFIWGILYVISVAQSKNSFLVHETQINDIFSAKKKDFSWLSSNYFCHFSIVTQQASKMPSFSFHCIFFSLFKLRLKSSVISIRTLKAKLRLYVDMKRLLCWKVTSFIPTLGDKEDQSG